MTDTEMGDDLPDEAERPRAELRLLRERVVDLQGRFARGELTLDAFTQALHDEQWALLVCARALAKLDPPAPADDPKKPERGAPPGSPASPGRLS